MFQMSPIRANVANPGSGRTRLAASAVSLVKYITLAPLHPLSTEPHRDMAALSFVSWMPMVSWLWNSVANVGNKTPPACF